MSSQLFWTLSPALVQLAFEPGVLLQLLGTGVSLVKYLAKKQKPQTLYIHERIVEEEAEEAVLVSTTVFD